MTAHSPTPAPQTTHLHSASSGLTPDRPALAIILARAGSKGMPGKNRAPIAGKPCAQWTIEHALKSTRIGLTLLSTDDEALIDLALSRHVPVARRPAALASDTATVDAAAREALSQLQRADIIAPDEHTRAVLLRSATLLSPTTPIVILYANVPVRPADLTDRALNLLISSRADSVQSYARTGKAHPYWMARLDDSGTVRPWQGDILNHNIYRRQDLPPCHLPDGGVLCTTRRALMLDIPNVPPGPHTFFGHDRRGIETREGDVIDIDTPIDALVADAVLRSRV
jgi:CMP-N-acetylneuraminic acid synthetase